MEMFAVWVKKFSCGELDDVFAVVFDTKKQARNFAAKRSVYPLEVSNPFKVNRDWCNSQRPSYMRMRPHQEIALVCWEKSGL